MKKATILCVTLALVVAFFFGAKAFYPEEERDSAGARLYFGETPVTLIIADTERERMQGLSGHPGLSEGEGMLFIFPTDGQYGFWMKDMLFSIDIIWLDKSFSVVGVEENFAPETFPAVAEPPVPVRYVLEVPAGFVAQHDVKKGDIARFLNVL